MILCSVRNPQLSRINEESLELFGARDCGGYVVAVGHKKCGDFLRQKGHLRSTSGARLCISPARKGAKQKRN
jgi:hypothetical protein